MLVRRLRGALDLQLQQLVGEGGGDGSRCGAICGVGKSSTVVDVIAQLLEEEDRAAQRG